MNLCLFAILLILICCIIKIIIEYHRIEQIEYIVSVVEFKKIVQINVFAILGSFFYSLSYDFLVSNELLSFLTVMLPLIIIVFIFTIQTQNTDGNITSLNDLSGCIFFISAITSPSIFIVGYIAILLYLSDKKRKEESNEAIKKVRNTQISTIINLIETILSCFFDFINKEILVMGFEERILIYAIVFVLSNFILPFFNNKIIEFTKK